MQDDMHDDICTMSATELGAAYRAKTLSPVEVLDACLQRADALEPTLHAFCTPSPDIARRQALDAEKRFAAGDVLHPLAGIPFGIKDLIATADIQTVQGCHAYKGFIPEEDDIVVERMRKAGAVILGKTNVPELGYGATGHNPVFPTTRNPWNTDLTPGGSSAGSATAVATGMCPIALGSDGGGSCRIPAAHTGIFGMKASMGRVPLYPGCRDERYPGISSWETIEHIGPLARTVEDAALVLSVIAGPDPRDRLSLPDANFNWCTAINGGIKGLKVAYSPDWGYAAVDPETRRVVDEAVRVFETDLGCDVEIAHPGFTDPLETFWTVVAMDSDLKGMRQMVEEHGHHMSPHLVDFLKRRWTAEEFAEANMQRKTLYNKMWRFMQNYDLLLTPTLACPPFPIDIQGPEKIDGRMVSSSQWMCFTFPMNLTGQPASSVPAGFTKSGLPIGMQIVGKHLGDEMVLRASAAFEQARPWAAVWPPIASDLSAKREMP